MVDDRVVRVKCKCHNEERCPETPARQEKGRRLGPLLQEFWSRLLQATPSVAAPIARTMAQALSDVGGVPYSVPKDGKCAEFKKGKLG